MTIKALVCAAMLLGGASAASAADLGGMKDGPMEPAYAGWDWTGKYFGVFGGYVFDESERDFALNGRRLNTDLPIDSNGLEEGIGGVHLGWAWSAGTSLMGFSFFGGTLIWGVEGDIGFSENIDYLATLRTRSGIAFGDLLLYSTSGVAFLSFDNSYSIGPDTFGDSEDHMIGLVYGGGIEKMFKPGWSIGVEALYYDFGKDRHSYDVEGTFSDRRDLDFWQVRGKLTYHVQGEPALEPLK